jgi:hypothetical protein
MAGKTEPPAIHAKPNIAELLIACVIGLMLTFTALFLGVMPLTDMAGKRDFVVYWATGQQLVHHGNPYDKDAVMRIERSAGLPTEAGTLYMRNLPWSLPLAVPLGFIGLGLARLPGGLGPHSLADARPHQKLSALAGSFICASHALPNDGADLSLRTPGVRSVSRSASQAPLHGRCFPLSLRTEASPVSGLWRSAAGVDTDH